MECHLRSVTLFLMTLILVNCLAAQTRNDSITLMEDNLRGYNRKHRPVLNYSKPVQVDVTFYLLSLQDLDEVNGLISFVLIMSMAWYDEVIVWDPAAYGGIQSQLFDIEDVWHPTLVTGSSVKGFQELATDWMSLRINSSGRAHYIPGVLVKSPCVIDVTYYPFDTQNCFLTFSTWDEEPNEIDIRVPEPYPILDYYTDHGQWKLVGAFTYGEVDTAYVHIRLERKPLFAIVNIIVPIILMSALNVLVFVLPADSGERVSYTITVLLAIAVFLTVVADNLPKTSEPISVLAYFLLINLLISCLICITTILNLRTFHNPDDLHIPVWEQRLTRVIGRVRSSRRNYESKNDGMVETQYADKHVDIDNTKDDKYGMKQPSVTHLSWKDVAIAFDRLLIICFSLACVLNIATYFVIIANG